MSEREAIDPTEFGRRFAEQLVKISAGRTDMTEDEVRAYAAEVASSYYEDWYKPELAADLDSTPEDWADEDFDCWEE